MAKQEPLPNPPSKENPRSSPLRLLILCPSTPPSLSTALDPTPASSPTASASPLPFPPLSRTLIPPLLRSLTSSSPPESVRSFSGYTSHPPLELRTAYYSADIGIWVDEVPHSSSHVVTINGDSDGDGREEVERPSLETYKSLLLSSEAKEVRDVIGGIVLTLPLFSRPAGNKSNGSLVQDSLEILDKYADLISAVSEIRDEVEAERGGDVAGVITLTAVSNNSAAAAGTGSSKIEQSLLDDLVEKWEEALLQKGVMGWDIVAWTSQSQSSTAPPTSSDPTSRPSPSEFSSTQPTTNAYGELVGIPRIVQVLETVDWFAMPSSITTFVNIDDTNDILDALSTGSDSHDTDTNDNDNVLQHEMLSVNLALRNPENDQDHHDSANPGSSSSLLSQPLLSNTSNPFLADVDDVELHGVRQNTDANDDDGDDFQIESLPGLMDRVMSIREEAAGLAEGRDREQFAKRALERIMRDL